MPVILMEHMILSSHFNGLECRGISPQINSEQRGSSIQHALFSRGMNICTNRGEYEMPQPCFSIPNSIHQVSNASSFPFLNK